MTPVQIGIADNNNNKQSKKQRCYWALSSTSQQQHGDCEVQGGHRPPYLLAVVHDQRPISTKSNWSHALDRFGRPTRCGQQIGTATLRRVRWLQVLAGKTSACKVQSTSFADKTQTRSNNHSSGTQERTVCIAARRRKRRLVSTQQSINRHPRSITKENTIDDNNR
jgi:hypothetical protein